MIFRNYDFRDGSDAIRKLLSTLESNNLINVSRHCSWERSVEWIPGVKRPRR